jgi:hypothetical protein
MKITIELKQEIKDLEGKAIGTHTLADLLVETLLNGNEGPPLKLLAISQDLKEIGGAQISVDDYNLLVGLVEKDKRLTTLGKARILEAMDASRIKAIT